MWGLWGAIASSHQRVIARAHAISLSSQASIFSLFSDRLSVCVCVDVLHIPYDTRHCFSFGPHACIAETHERSREVGLFAVLAQDRPRERPASDGSEADEVCLASWLARSAPLLRLARVGART